MLKKLVLPAPLACLALYCAITTGCGSSSSTPPPPPGPFNVAGNWQLSVSGFSGLGIINSTGQAVLLDNAGQTIVMPTITGANTFSGNATAYQAPPNGLSVGSSVSGTVSSATSISGTVTNSSGTTNFTLSPTVPLSGVISLPSGAKTGEPMGLANILQVAFASNGSITGTDGVGCTVTGTVTQDHTYNVFAVTLNSTGGVGCIGNLSGLGFESSSDYFNFNGGAPDTYFYVVFLTGQAQPFAVEFF